MCGAGVRCRGVGNGVVLLWCGSSIYPVIIVFGASMIRMREAIFTKRGARVVRTISLCRAGALPKAEKASDPWEKMTTCLARSSWRW